MAVSVPSITAKACPARFAAQRQAQLKGAGDQHPHASVTYRKVVAESVATRLSGPGGPRLCAVCVQHPKSNMAIVTMP